MNTTKLFFFFLAALIVLGYYYANVQTPFTLSSLLFLGTLPLFFLYRTTHRRNTDDLRAQIVSTTDQLRQTQTILSTKVEEKTKELIFEGFSDPLTTLPNRHRLQYDMAHRHYRALLIINIRRFREIKNFFGNETADALLKQMAALMQSIHLSPYRLSGDEFVVLIEETQSPEELTRICQRLLHRLGDEPFKVGEESFYLEIAIGIDAGENVALGNADIALHEAKRSITHIAFYDRQSAPNDQIQHNIALIETIRNALGTGRIVCFYQPVVSCSSGRIEQYETLVRMIDESSRIIPPLEFLPIALKSTLYPQITRAVVEQACKTFQERNEAFSINLSMRDILNRHTVRFIEETIIKTTTAERVIFEIRESEGAENINALVHFIRRMKNLGAKITLDRYGIDETSLERILKMDLDYIKIDGSLITSILNDPKSDLIVRHIVDLAEKLNVATIAQHVEDESLYDRVKTSGIPYIQGYYLGKASSLPL